MLAQQTQIIIVAIIAVIALILGAVALSKTTKKEGYVEPEKCWADFFCKGGKKCKGTGTKMVTQNGNEYEAIINGVCA